MTTPSHDILIVTGDSGAGARLDEAVRRAGLRGLVVAPGILPNPARGGEGDEAMARGAIVDARAGAEVLARMAGSVERAVVLGERGRSEDLLLALRSGAVDFLPLDFTPSEAADAIGRLIRPTGEPPPALEVPEKGGGTRTVKLHGRSYTLGRDASNDIFVDSVVVSRFLARIIRKGGGAIIADNGSRHGTFVNGERIEEKALEDGARIRLGNTGAPVLTFRTARPEPTRSDGATGSGYSSQEMKDIAGLVDTFLKLNGDLLLEDILQIVVARSIELAGAERGMILLAVDGPGDGTPTPASPLRIAMARNHDGTPIDAEGLLMSRKIPEAVLRTGNGVILEDLLEPGGATAHPSTIEIGVRSAMCVPLRPRRAASGPRADILGVLYVDSTARVRPFSPRVLHALESLASEAAGAILSSHLYEECLEKRALDAELRIAREIQEGFLPPASFLNSWMELHGTSRSSEEVGGDLLDYFPFDDGGSAGASPGGRVSLVVGDVSGKGIAAAIFSSMLDGLSYGIAVHSSRETALGSVVAELNRHLASRAGHGKFVSMVLGTLLEDGRFTYVNAGHNPPLRIAPGRRPELLRSSGMILGMLEEATYATGEITLVPGEVLVLYSDGITEARAPGGELFGMERLEKAAMGSSAGTPREIHDAILGEVASFTRGAAQADDLTLMVVKYRPTRS